MPSAYDQACVSPSNSNPITPSAWPSGDRSFHAGTPTTLLLDTIVPDDENNHRFALEPQSVRQLADEIRAVGLLNPITVRREGQQYVVVAGHRRLAALRLLGATHVQANVIDGNAQLTAGARLIENLARENLSPVEEARAVYRMIEQGSQTPDELAARLNRSVQWVNHRLALANYPDDLLDALHTRSISIAVADELATLADDATRTYLLDAATRSGCTAAQARAWTAAAAVAQADPTASPQTQDFPHLAPAHTVVTRPCALCEQPKDVTTLAYLTICHDCQLLITEKSRSGGP